MIFISPRFFRLAALTFCCVFFVLQPARAKADAAKAYTRIYIENRCYQPVFPVIERERNNVVLAPVLHRDTGIVLFTLTKNIHPEDTVCLSRRDAEQVRVTLGFLMEKARHEQWVMGGNTVDSWFVTLCRQELPLKDPGGSTIRPVVPDEKVSEYEWLFSRVEGSADPMHVYAGLPILVSLNGVPLHVVSTDGGGMLRVLLPADTTGIVTLEAGQKISRTLELGRDWMPVRKRPAKIGEKVLVEPRPLNGSDWPGL